MSVCIFVKLESTKRKKPEYHIFKSKICVCVCENVTVIKERTTYLSLFPALSLLPLQVTMAAASV